MTNTEREGLIELLEGAARHLQTLLINKTGIIRVDASTSDRWEWMAPPMHHPGRLGPVRFNDIAERLYGNRDATINEITTLWQQCVEAVVKRTMTTKRAVDYVHSLFPNLPLSTKDSVRTTLTRFIYASGWHHGVAVVDRNSALLKTRSETLGFDGRAIVWDGNRRLVNGPMPAHFFDALRAPLGRPRLGTNRSAALAKHLSTAFPDLLAEIDFLFAAATTVGKDAEAAIANLFELHKVHPDDEPKVVMTVWTRCRHLVDTATHNPTPELYALLRPYLSWNGFRQTFGNPSRKPGAYSKPTRQKHRDLLDKLKHGELNVDALKASGSKARSQTESLLELQRLIGKMA